MNYCGKTDIGKVRKNNQDSFFADFLPPIGKLCGNAFLAVVCDGMGGAAGGQIASSLAVESFVSRLKTKLSASAENASKLSEIRFSELMDDAVQYANSKVYSKSKKEPELYGMGTTLVACLIVKKNIYIVNVGDSRLYAVSGDRLCQITVDHSYVQALVDSGSISEGEATNHPDKNIITRAVGIRNSVTPDAFLISDYPDSLLLCTDGLTNMVDGNGILAAITSPKNVTGTVTELIRHANEGGGKDNITAVLIKL